MGSANSSLVRYKRREYFLTLFKKHSLCNPPPHHKMLRKAMVGMAIVGLSAVDAYSVLQKRDGAHAHDHGHAAPAPSDGYGEPAAAYGAEEAALPDLTPIIIGILALVGLSLLFPTHVSVDAGRKKRSAAENANPMTDVVERVNEIYN